MHSYLQKLQRTQGVSLKTKRYEFQRASGKYLMTEVHMSQQQVCLYPIMVCVLYLLLVLMVWNWSRFITDNLGSLPVKPFIIAIHLVTPSTPGITQHAGCVHVFMFSKRRKGFSPVTVCLRKKAFIRGYMYIDTFDSIVHILVYTFF